MLQGTWAHASQKLQKEISEKQLLLINKESQPVVCGNYQCVENQEQQYLLSALSHFNQFVFGLFIYSPK